MQCQRFIPVLMLTGSLAVILKVTLLVFIIEYGQTIAAKVAALKCDVY